MSNHFSIRQAFLYFGHDHLRSYFEHISKPLSVSWEQIDVRDPDPLLAAWQTLDAEAQLLSERDLQDAWTLGNDRGIQSLHSIAEKLGTPFILEVAPIESALDRALWVRVNRSEVWEQMGDFLPVDQLVNRRMWRRFTDLERTQILDPDNKARELAHAVGDYFEGLDGYCNRCFGEHHIKPSSSESYFPVYINTGVDPNPVLTEDNQLKKELRRKLGVIAFVYSQGKGQLRIYVERDALTARQLFELFHQVVLGKPAPPDDSRQTAYQLNRVLSEDFRLTVPGIHEVSDIAITQMRVRPRSNLNRSIELRGDTRNMGRSDTVNMLDNALNLQGYPRHLLDVDKIHIRAELRRGRSDGKKSLSFDVCWPNGGNLHNQPEQLQPIGEKILQYWKIDTQPMEAPNAWESFLALIDTDVTVVGRSVVDKWPNGMLQLLIQEGVLQETDPSRTCHCMWCGGTHDVVERMEGDQARDFMYCNMLAKLIGVRADRIQQWEINPVPIIRTLAAALRINQAVQTEGANGVWRLGISTFTNLDRPLYFALSSARQQLAEGDRVFEDDAVVIVPTAPWSASGLETRGIRFVSAADVLSYTDSGYASDPGAVFDALSVPKPGRSSLLKPWAYSPPSTVLVSGQEYDATQLRGQVMKILSVASGRLSIPITEFFQKNGSSVWKERLSGNLGTAKQRGKISTAINRVNNKLIEGGIPMVLELPDNGEEIVVKTLNLAPQALTASQ